MHEWDTKIKYTFKCNGNSPRVFNMLKLSECGVTSGFNIVMCSF